MHRTENDAAIILRPCARAQYFLRDRKCRIRMRFDKAAQARPSLGYPRAFIERSLPLRRIMHNRYIQSEYLALNFFNSSFPTPRDILRIRTIEIQAHLQADKLWHGSFDCLTLQYCVTKDLRHEAAYGRHLRASASSKLCANTVTQSKLAQAGTTPLVGHAPRLGL